MLLPFVLQSPTLASGDTIAGLKNRRKMNPPIANEPLPGYFFSTSERK